jgi:hypothetical protein
METPNPELLQAYKRTKFIVDFPKGQAIIRHGDCSVIVDEIFSACATKTGTFITAHNPRSQRLSDSENRKRHRSLIADIEKQGFPYFTGRGVGTDGDWPAEESLFVVGTSREQATALGAKYEQLAIVWVEMGKAAEIVLC